MNTDIQPFTFPTTGQPVRTISIDGEPWFVAADVATILGQANIRVAVGRLPDRMRGVTQADTPGGRQQVQIINEAGAYRLTMRSNLPQAERFQDWLAEEVVPSIRRTGSYSVAHEIPASFADALELAAKQARELEAVREHVAEIEPAAQAWDTLSNASGDYSLREAAQILSRDPGVATIGQNRLLKYLRELSWVDSHSTPYQGQVDIGRLVQRTDTYEHPNTHEPRLYTQVRITPKGLAELRHRLRIAAQPTLTGASR